jgi:single-stranded-DNA-specific exonuclease
VLLRRGLRALAASAKPGLRALMAVAGIEPGKLDERSIGFALAPRLNAAGRLYRADAGLELILTEDPARAAQIATELDTANHERRQIERRIRFEAEAQMAELGERDAYVLSGETWHAGVIGIVASRLVEQSGRPVVMLALDGELAKGSGRSIEDFDLLAGLRACEGQLTRYGGHRAAAGMELRREHVESFALALAAHATSVLSEREATIVERVDAVLGAGELSMELAEELRALAPFGRGNPPVCLMLADATLRFTVASRGTRARAVSFGQGGRLPVEEGAPVQATFALEVNEWNGVSEPRLLLRRVEAIEPPALEPASAAQEPPAPAELLLF